MKQYFVSNPDTRVQAQRLADELKKAETPVSIYGKRDSNHSRLNNDLGDPEDPATKKMYEFLDPLLGANE